MFETANMNKIKCFCKDQVRFIYISKCNNECVTILSFWNDLFNSINSYKNIEEGYYLLISVKFSEYNSII